MLTMNWLLIVMLCFFYDVRSGSGPWSQLYNRQFITGKYGINGLPFTASPHLVTHNYISTFFDTINSIQDVYYCTQELQVDLHQIYPTSNNTILRYNIHKAASSTTYLKTSVTGYLQYPYISLIQYRFMIILASNTLFTTSSNYVQVDTIAFNKTNIPLQVLTSIPKAYPNSNNIVVLTFLRDVYMSYPTSLQNSDSNLVELEIGSSVLANGSVINKLSVRPYLLDVASTFDIRYLVITYNPTIIQTQFPNYHFQSSNQTLPFSGSSANFNTIADLDNVYTTWILGISSVTFYNYAINFNFTYFSTSQSSFVYTFAGSFMNVTFSYWATAYYGCNGPYYIIDYTLKHCNDSCNNGSYYDYIHMQCFPCYDLCQTCYTFSQCSSCNSSNFRVLSNLSCIPIGGYYQSNTPIAGQCDSICINCSLTAGNCTACVNTSALSENTCMACDILFEGCDSCNETVCFSCNSTYPHQINQTYCTIPCENYKCAACLYSNSSYCLVCYLPYILVDNLCLDICGNGIVYGGEDCDDANNESYDGCSSKCQNQQYYQCVTMSSFLGYNYTAYCAYTHAINLTVLTLEKLNQNNSLRIVMEVQQYMENFWNDYNTFGGYFTVNTSFSNMQGSFISSWSFNNRRLFEKTSRLLVSPKVTGFQSNQLIEIVFQYNDDLHGSQIGLSFDFRNSWDPRVNQIPIQEVSLAVVPDNNLFAHNYVQQTYNQQQLIQTCLQVICIVYLACYVISLFAGNKRIMAEGIMVVQIAFAGLASCPNLNPLQSALSTLTYANNPYNVLYSDSFRPFDDSLVPNRLRGTQMYSQFLYNLNTGLIFCVLPLIIGLVLHFVALCKCLIVQRQIKVQRAARMLTGEYVFSGLILIGCVAGCSSALEFQFGDQDLTSGVISLVACIIVILALLIYGILWLKFTPVFGQYYQILINESTGAIIFSLVYFYSGPFIGFLSYFLYNFSFSTMLIISFVLILYAVVFIKPIFKKTLDRVRVQINLLTIIFIQLPFLFAQVNQDYSFDVSTDMELMSSISVPLFLGINLLVNFAFFTYLIVKKIVLYMKESQQKKIDSEEQAYRSERGQEINKMYNNSLNTPLQTILTNNYKSRFIEESEKSQNPLNEKEAKFKNDINDFFDQEKLQVQKHMQTNQYQGDKGEITWNKQKPLPKYKYSQNNYIINHEYQEIDQL